VVPRGATKATPQTERVERRAECARAPGAAAKEAGTLGGNDRAAGTGGGARQGEAQARRRAPRSRERKRKRTRESPSEGGAKGRTFGCKTAGAYATA